MNRHGLLLSLSLCFTSFAALGCDETSPRGGVSSFDEAADHDEAHRGGEGKADVVLEGFCGAMDGEEAACGGPAPVGNCWCDEACEQYGDCCVDAFDACGVGEPQPAVSQCLADAHCDEGQQCAGGVCIEVEPEPVSCNDGSSLHPLCDIKPGCPDGEVAAVINGCFACVDAVTCE